MRRPAPVPPRPSPPRAGTRCLCEAGEVRGTQSPHAGGPRPHPLTALPIRAALRAQGTGAEPAWEAGPCGFKPPVAWGVLRGRKNPAGKFAPLPPRPRRQETAGASGYRVCHWHPTRRLPITVAHQREGSSVLGAQRTSGQRCQLRPPAGPRSRKNHREGRALGLAQDRKLHPGEAKGVRVQMPAPKSGVPGEEGRRGRPHDRTGTHSETDGKPWNPCHPVPWRLRGEGPGHRPWERRGALSATHVPESCTGGALGEQQPPDTVLGFSPGSASPTTACCHKATLARTPTASCCPRPLLSRTRHLWEGALHRVGSVGASGEEPAAWRTAFTL